MLSQNPILAGSMLGSGPADCSVLGHLRPIESRIGLRVRVQKAKKQRNDRRKPNGSCSKTCRTAEVGVTPLALMRLPHPQLYAANLRCPRGPPGLPA